MKRKISAEYDHMYYHTGMILVITRNGSVGRL
jgi:hypothetical protein